MVVNVLDVFVRDVVRLGKLWAADSSVSEKKIEVFQEFTKALLKIISETKKLFYLY